MALTVRPWLRWALRIVLPVLVVVGGWQVWSNYETMRFEQVSAEYQSARKRIDLEAALPPVSRDKTSPYRYYAAAAELTDVQETYPLQAAIDLMRRAIASRQPVDPAVAVDARINLDRNRDVLRLIETGTTLPLSGNEAIFRQLRSINAITNVTPVLSLRTLEAAAADDGDGAAKALIVALQFAYALGLDPHSFVATEKAMLMPALVADATVVLQRTRPSDAALEELAAVLSKAFRDNDLERVVTAQAGTEYAWFAGRRNPLTRHQGRLAMQSSVEAIRIARQPWPQRVRGMETLPAWHFPAFGESQYLTGDLMKRMYLSSARAHADAVALDHAALVAVRVEQYRRRTGIVPDSLAALALPTEEALDPYTGGSLLYQRRNDGFVTYSVGYDGRDDGGSLERRPGPLVGWEGATKDVGVSVAVQPR
ncbi:MAG TPA: hypothetical protein VL173_01735 [Vicinamibacterales bacterium]|nr:hypothetical protein [Vicinamibacterales bacterium]